MTESKAPAALGFRSIGGSNFAAFTKLRGCTRFTTLREALKKTGENTKGTAWVLGSGFSFRPRQLNRTYLAEPDGVSVVYVQYGDNWKLYPPDARTLRRIMIAPAEPLPDGETQNSVIAEISTGAGQGFGVWPWPSPDAPCGPGGK